MTSWQVIFLLFHIDKIYEDEDFVDVSERLEKDQDKQNVMGEL